jgi:hypothetical protein
MTTIGTVYAALNTFLSPYGVVLKSSETKKTEEQIRTFVEQKLNEPSNELNLQDWLHKPREEIVFAISEVLDKALARLLNGDLGFLDQVIKYHNISGDDVAKLLHDGGIRTA